MEQIPTAPDVARLTGVSKKFIVRKDNSLKERLVTLGRLGRRHREEFWALKDIDLTIRAGTTIGLIGHNGSGKSTLLKVIGGILEPTDGTVQRRGRLAALLELGAGFHPDLTGRENVFLNASIMGLSRTETQERFEEILAFSGIGDFIDTQVKFYSSGMYVRLAFAVAVSTQPDILLVDEVLAVGDEAFQRKCLDKIREFQQAGCTIVIVTHSLGQVTELCERAVLLNGGEIVIDGDPYEAVARFRDLLEERRLAELTPRTELADDMLGVRAVTVRSDDRSRDRDVVVGDDLVIDLELVSNRSMEGMALGLQINNTTGSAVWGTSTKLMNVDLPPLIGVTTVRFRLGDARFGPGKYSVNVSIMDATGVHLHDWLQAATFDGSDDKTSFGVLRLQHDFAIVTP